MSNLEETIRDEEAIMIYEETTTTMEEHRDRINKVRIANAMNNYRFEPVQHHNGWRCRFWSIFNECAESGVPLSEHETVVSRETGGEALTDAKRSVRRMIRCEMEPSSAYDNM